jgi:hypothetical protein
MPGHDGKQFVTRRDAATRAIAHIGCLFSDLVDAGQLSFFDGSPDSILLCRVRH